MTETNGRRGHNEGSIYKRKSDGRWVGSVNVGYDLKGKRKRRQIYGATRREVAERMKEVLRDQQRGLPVAPAREALGPFLERWLADTIRPNRSIATYERYRSLVTNHLAPALGHERLQKLSTQRVQSFLAAKLATGLSARTVSDMLATLHTALEQAVKWNLVGRNVATLVEGPRVIQKEVHYLTPEEAAKLLEAMRGDRLENLFIITLSLGLRRGEALGLRWLDVDLERGRANICQAVQRAGGELRVTGLKTKSSRRSVNLPAIAVEALRRQAILQREEQLAAGTRWKGGKRPELVFTSLVGTPIEPRNAKRTLDRVLERAGIPHMRIHDLRHTAASLLLSQGVSPKLISEILGHARIGVTLDPYSHLYEPQRLEAAALMDAALGQLSAQSTAQTGSRVARRTGS